MGLESNYDKHVFVCINSRVDTTRSSCSNKGLMIREEIIKKLSCIDTSGLKIRINKSGCLNKCELGPVIVIYPQGFLYYNVEINDVSEIIEESILKNMLITLEV